MRYLITTLLIVMAMLAASVASASVPTRVLIRGQSETISFKYEIGDVALSDPAVCDYLVGQERRSIYINAKDGGEATITVWDVEGRQRDEILIRVVTTTLKDILDGARETFGDLKGVDIHVRDGRIEIEGEVVDPEDFRRIEAAAESNPKMKSHIKLAPDVMERTAEAIRSAMDVPGVAARAVRDRIILEGMAYSAADKRRAVEIAKIYYADVMDLIDLRETGRSAGRGELIELEFHMTEIKKSALRQFGVNWAPGSFPGGSSGNATANPGLLSSVGDLGKNLIGFVFQLVPKLKFVRERGDGRVLENPSIIVKSGELARIFSGSEVPYYKGDEVQFKKMGIDIQAEPIRVSGGIDLKIAATLSSPSADIRGAVDTNTVSTTSLCPFGQSLVLGNVIRNGDVKMKNRVPENVDTSSALFTLFLSKDFQSNRSEFVIFVTPRLIKQPTTAEAKLRDFFATEEMMIRDRSKKEYKSWVAEKSGGIFDVKKKKRNRRGRRRWR